MLIFSRAKIRFRTGRVIVEGAWLRHRNRIQAMATELGLERGVVRLRGARIIISGVPPALHQRIRNVLVNDCPA